MDRNALGSLAEKEKQDRPNFLRGIKLTPEYTQADQRDYKKANNEGNQDIMNDLLFYISRHRIIPSFLLTPDPKERFTISLLLWPLFSG